MLKPTACPSHGEFFATSSRKWPVGLQRGKESDESLHEQYGESFSIKKIRLGLMKNKEK